MASGEGHEYFEHEAVGKKRRKYFFLNFGTNSVPINLFVHILYQYVDIKLFNIYLLEHQCAPVAEFRFKYFVA